ALEGDVAGDVVAQVQAEDAAVGHLPIDQQRGVADAADRVGPHVLLVEAGAEGVLGPGAVAAVDGDEDALAGAGGGSEERGGEKRGGGGRSVHRGGPPRRCAPLYM